jgi:hypothetical protein
MSLKLALDCQGYALDLYSQAGPFRVGEDNMLTVRNGRFTNYAPQAAAQWSIKPISEQYNVTKSVVGEASNSTIRMENLFMEHPCVVSTPLSVAISKFK